MNKDFETEDNDYIANLEISARARHALRVLGVYDDASLMRVTEDELSRIRSCGTLNEIVDLQCDVDDRGKRYWEDSKYELSKSARKALHLLMIWNEADLLKADVHRFQGIKQKAVDEIAELQQDIRDGIFDDEPEGELEEALRLGYEGGLRQAVLHLNALMQDDRFKGFAVMGTATSIELWRKQV